LALIYLTTPLPSLASLIDLGLSLISIWRIFNQLLPIVRINDTADAFKKAIAEHFPLENYAHPAELTLHLKWLNSKEIGWKIYHVRPTFADMKRISQVIIAGYASLAAQLLSTWVDEIVEDDYYYYYDDNDNDASPIE
jgi:hypothetical protein